MLIGCLVEKNKQWIYVTYYMIIFYDPPWMYAIMTFLNLTSFNSEQNLRGIVAKFDQLGFDHKHPGGRL